MKSRRTTHTNAGVGSYRKEAWLFLVPIVLYFGIVYYYPVVYSLILSLFRWTFISNKFIGLENFATAFTNPDELTVLWNTIVYVVLQVGVGTVLSLVFALAANQIGRRGSSIYKAMYFVPSVVSLSAISLIWKWIYEPRIGILNFALGLLGFPRHGWLVDPSLALASIIIVGIWQNTGFNMVIFSAGIASIDPTYYEAGRLDGVRPLQSFRYITFPLLRPITLFVVVTSIILAFRVFTPVFVLTQGGPVNSTNVIAYEIYQQGFGQFRFGYASTLAVLLLAFVALITIAQMRVSKAIDNEY